MGWRPTFRDRRGAAPDPNQEFDSIEAAAAFTVEAGGVAFLAHPYWSGLEASTYLEAPSLSGVELMNGGSELAERRRPLGGVCGAVLHHTRGACLGIASDDCHTPGQDSNVAWTMVKTRARSREGVLEALRSGAFYATTGPDRSVRVADDGVEVRCSGARKVTLRSGPGTAAAWMRTRP